jgi:hypothetical protein
VCRNFQHMLTTITPASATSQYETSVSFSSTNNPS